MSERIELRLQLSYSGALALRTLCERLTSESARQIAAGDAQMQDALHAVDQLRWELIAALACAPSARG